ncbi:hypothetical protein G9444_0646 [Rhodococcus erythropolis]|uniref:Secreted protein n=1 Tax=Rhodococcus erythropolis TaxID=1833 RepID=A0A6G9CM53_RHOER|nr:MULTISPECIES: DUF748 domain-containing protein [Rhodococcus]MCJ0896525.1 DUF748 domain-containing protein [Rhodococcus sp. ARC_M13]QIP37890.1 hypothetical protein G9444_0646 [Rhodococcus erythropolis]UKO87203.1 DUF748 domain-containing protein [Rhodococcus erythropolis]
MSNPTQTATEVLPTQTLEGKMFSGNGYTLELATSEAAVGSHVPLQFRILDSVGTPLTRYTDTHDKQLHLIVVGLDLTGFQHVHPELDENGNWRVSVDFDHAGDYRVFADFTPDGGDGMTLSADVRVAGSYDPRPLPAATAATTVDGYTVSLEGAAHAGQTSKLTLSVSLDGIPVTDLQPYLAAYGHLVALRASDLAYLHVHPDGHPGDGVTPAGPAITFYANMPSAEDYRLFLDFKHGEVVRTAEFTLTADNATTPGVEHSSHSHHGH